MSGISASALPPFSSKTRALFFAELLKTKRPARMQPFIPGSQGRLKTR